MIVKGEVYCGSVKFRWPLVIAYSALFTIFFHYEIRHTNSIWIEIVGGLIVYVAYAVAYISFLGGEHPTETNRNRPQRRSMSVTADCVNHPDSASNLLTPLWDCFLRPCDRYRAACSGSLSAEGVSLGIGMLTITEVPEPFDSIFISPWR